MNAACCSNFGLASSPTYRNGNPLRNQLHRQCITPISYVVRWTDISDNDKNEVNNAPHSKSTKGKQLSKALSPHTQIETICTETSQKQTQYNCNAITLARFLDTRKHPQEFSMTHADNCGTSMTLGDVITACNTRLCTLTGRWFAREIRLFCQLVAVTADGLAKMDGVGGIRHTPTHDVNGSPITTSGIEFAF